MIKLEINGMTCQNCVHHVTQALSRVPGVEEVVSVDLSRNEAIVNGHPQLEQLIRAVEAAGYEARSA